MDKKIIIQSKNTGKRLDTVIAGHLKDCSRSRIKQWINSGDVKIGRAAKKSSYKVKAGDEISIHIELPKELSAEPQNIPLNILYEDSDIVVVNKSADMVVHPAAGNLDRTLVNALLYHCKDLSGIGGYLRPGIVHRLDKGTSGVIVVAKNDLAHMGLTEQFKKRSVEKTYLALIYGVPKEKKGVFSLKIGRHPTARKKMSTKTRRGREAITHWELAEHFDKYISLVKIRLVTGRTHQVRVHFSAHGMPLLGDMVYGGKKTIKRIPEGEYKDIASRAGRPMLHAASLSLCHPRSSRRMKFEAELPGDFREILEGLRAISS